jgi:hypothetical protein
MAGAALHDGRALPLPDEVNQRVDEVGTAQTGGEHDLGDCLIA